MLPVFTNTALYFFTIEVGEPCVLRAELGTEELDSLNETKDIHLCLVIVQFNVSSNNHDTYT